MKNCDLCLIFRQRKDKENSEALRVAGIWFQHEDVEVSTAVDDVDMVDDFVEDIDADDAGNPQLVVEYVNDIYAYLRQLESAQCVKANYLAGQTELLPKMRAVLIDWLVGVHLQFHLLQETLYTTVAILDRFLQVEVGSVSRNKI